MKLWIDLETRSPIPIKRGVALYATKARVMTAQWAIDDQVAKIADLHVRGDQFLAFPDELLDAAIMADELWAHGAEFEQQILATVPEWRALDIAADKWRCTMALARMHGLPGALDKLSTIFKLGLEGKDERGHDLIQVFCVPNDDGTYHDKHSHPKQWAEFCEYALQDVPSMRAIYRKCPKWNATPRMWSIWHLDQKMNARGIAVDLKLCEGAIEATEKAKKHLKEEVTDITLGAVEAATQRSRLLAYCAEWGVTLPDLTADTVERRLEDETLPEHIKELLRIRQQASKASTAKYKRARDQHVGGRLRNLLVFCGAQRTGRWAGRTFQPQNLPRPTTFPEDIAFAIEHFRNRTIEQYAPDEVLKLGASCLRGIMVAGDGRRLVVADLANIEGRDMAWIAGEEWKLDAFRAYDRREGPDLYKVAYARSFNIDPNEIADEGDWRRQIGKVMELALQYYGGVGAFCSMAETYGLRLEALADSAWPIIPKDKKVEANAAWVKADKRHRTYGLDERIWKTCHALVLMWREAHPAIVGFWFELEQAVKMAILNPGKRYTAARVEVDRVENWMRIKLPSGRYLSYPAPRTNDYDLNFLGVCSYTKQWKRISTYSGKLTENIVQGNSADILMDGLLAADAAGYEPELSVHDEIICEPRDDVSYTDKGLSKLMVESSPWAAGLPLAAKGFTAYRYAKH